MAGGHDDEDGCKILKCKVSENVSQLELDDVKEREPLYHQDDRVFTDNSNQHQSFPMFPDRTEMEENNSALAESDQKRTKSEFETSLLSFNFFATVKVNPRKQSNRSGTLSELDSLLCYDLRQLETGTLLVQSFNSSSGAFAEWPSFQPRISTTGFRRNAITIPVYSSDREKQRWINPDKDKRQHLQHCFVFLYQKVSALNQHSLSSLIISDQLNDSNHESNGRFVRGKRLREANATSISNFSVGAENGIITEEVLHVVENGEIGLYSSLIPQDVNGPYNYHFRLDTLAMKPFFRWNLRPAAAEVASGGFYANVTDLLICYGCNKRHRLADFSEMPLHANFLHEPNCEFRHYKLCRFCSRGEESIGPDDHEECVQCGRQLLMRVVNTDPTPAQELMEQPENQARAFVDPQCCVEGCRNLLDRNELVEICTVCHGQVCNQCSREGRRHIHY